MRLSRLRQLDIRLATASVVSTPRDSRLADDAWRQRSVPHVFSIQFMVISFVLVVRTSDVGPSVPHPRRAGNAREVTYLSPVNFQSKNQLRDLIPGRSMPVGAATPLPRGGKLRSRWCTEGAEWQFRLPRTWFALASLSSISKPGS